MFVVFSYPTVHLYLISKMPHAFSLTRFCSQLLLDCGLGGGGGSEGATEAVVAQHRVLIFCQLKSMLDIVEHDLLKPRLPTVTYLRLDGSVQAGQRHSIVSRLAHLYSCSLSNTEVCSMRVC